MIIKKFCYTLTFTFSLLVPMALVSGPSLAQENTGATRAPSALEESIASSRQQIVAALKNQQELVSAQIKQDQSALDLAQKELKIMNLDSKADSDKKTSAADIAKVEAKIEELSAKIKTSQDTLALLGASIQDAESCKIEDLKSVSASLKDRGRALEKDKALLSAQLSQLRDRELVILKDLTLNSFESKTPEQIAKDFESELATFEAKMSADDRAAFQSFVNAVNLRFKISATGLDGDRKLITSGAEQQAISKEDATKVKFIAMRLISDSTLVGNNSDPKTHKVNLNNTARKVSSVRTGTERYVSEAESAKIVGEANILWPHANILVETMRMKDVTKTALSGVENGSEIATFLAGFVTNPLAASQSGKTGAMSAQEEKKALEAEISTLKVKIENISNMAKSARETAFKIDAQGIQSCHKDLQAAKTFIEEGNLLEAANQLKSARTQFEEAQSTERKIKNYHGK